MQQTAGRIVLDLEATAQLPRQALHQSKPGRTPDHGVEIETRTLILDGEQEGFARALQRHPDQAVFPAFHAVLDRVGQQLVQNEGERHSRIIRELTDFGPAFDADLRREGVPRGLADSVQKLLRIEPRGIVKEIKDITERVRQVAEESAEYRTDRANQPGAILQMPKDELIRMIKDLESQMKTAAKNLEFEKAALLRDQIVELRRMSELDPAAVSAPAVRA
jgi:hypothetical protein